MPNFLKPPFTFLFFGRSGSGKGTQAKLLQEYITNKYPESNVLYIETGQEFRNFIKQDNYVAKLTKENLEQGKLLPPFMPVWIWTDEFVKNFTGKEHLILDGLARRATEAPILDSALKFFGRNNAVGIVLETSRDWSIQRLKERNRNDDVGIKEMDKKMSWYDSNVIPAIEFLSSQKGYEFIHVSGEDSIEKVHTEILGKLGI